MAQLLDDRLTIAEAGATRGGMASEFATACADYITLRTDLVRARYGCDASRAIPEGSPHLDTPAVPPDDDELEIDIDGSTLRVRGDIDAHSAATLGDTLRTQPGSVHLDLAGVAFVDSSGLRVLIESHQLLDERGDRLTIVNPAPSVQRMFELSVVDEYLNIRHS